MLKSSRSLPQFRLVSPDTFNWPDETLTPQEAPLLSEFYEDFKALMIRQSNIEREALSAVSGLDVSTDSRAIARYPKANVVNMVGNLLRHLHKSERIVPQAFTEYLSSKFGK